MRIVVPRETAPGEQRVALVPESCKKLIRVGYEIAIEAGAGNAAGFTDLAYRDAGAATESDPAALIAAGMVAPARVFVIGAGVAGLQAIATARRLGATVLATDVRPEVKEQIESVGGKYVGIELKQSAAAGGGYAAELSPEDRQRQSQLLVEECAKVDVVITTALIGGVFAPRLITAETVRSMKPGSIIVDLGADGGGNCELSKPGETVHVNGVAILAPLNVAATMPFHASLLFARNLTAFVEAFTHDKAFQLDRTDYIQQGALVTHGGEVTHARTRDALQKVNA